MMVCCCAAFVAAARDVSAQPAPRAAAAAAQWYRRSRAIDLTGSNPRDSIVLLATGTRVDSLSLSMSFYVGGAMVHRQRWSSADELFDADSLRRSPAKLSAFMRRRLDEIVGMVKRERIDPEQVKHNGDVALLKTITPRPTHQILLAFGFENGLYFVWDATKRRLVLFMECC